MSDSEDTRRIKTYYIFWILPLTGDQLYLFIYFNSCVPYRCVWVSILFYLNLCFYFFLELKG